MKEISASINIHEDQYEKIADTIYDHIEDRLRNDIESNIDIDQAMTEWMHDNFNVRDWIDGDIADFIDVESEARNLLENYSPSAICGTGDAFTNAIARAIRYIFLRDDENAKDILRAVETFKKKSEADEIISKNEESLKAKHFEEFKNDLEKLAEANKNTINPYTNTVII